MKRGQPLEILYLEDSPADAEMVSERLHADGLDFNMRIVDNGDEFKKSLAESRPDVVLSDYRLPGFDGPAALELTHEKLPDTPFIFVTGTIGDDKAVETLKRGATDFVLKGNLARLVPAISRALNEKKIMQERHALFEALRESEKRYSSLVENLPVGIFRISASYPGRFLQANLALARMYGVDSVEELVRIPVIDFYAETAERNRLLTDIKERNIIKAQEIRLRTKSGGIAWGSITATCHRNSSGKIDWIDGIIEDVTERKKVEEERERILARQVAVNIFQRSLLAPAPLEKKLQSITEGIVRIFNADFCRIWLIRPGDLCDQGCIHARVKEGPHVCRYRERCLHLLSSSGRYVHTDGEGHRRVPFGCYKIGLVASGDEHKFITNDVQNDPRVHNQEWARALGLVSFAGYQLRVPGDQTKGVLALFAKHPISSWEDAMLDGLGSTAALVVQQIEAQEALRTSEENFRGIFESSRDAIMTIEPPAWKFSAANPATVEMFRAKSVEDLFSYMLWQLSPPRQPDGSDSKEKAKGMLETAMRDGSSFFEWMHRRTDGRDFPATVLLTRVDLPGKQFIQATIRDVTEHKLAEMELRRINEEMDLILGSITSIIIGVSVKDRITHWNSHAENVLGVSSKDVLGKQFYECGVKWDWNAVYEGISKSLLSSTIIRLDDLRYTRTDGKDGVLGLTINPLYREGDILAGFMILGRDLTERRVLEYRLLQSQKLEAIGQLAAGVAHEINSPLQYVGDNLRFITKSLKDVIGIQKGFLEVMESSSCTCADAIKPLRDSIDLNYLIEELPKAAEQSLEGVERVSKIVKSMKAFAHPGTGAKSPAQINKSIENTTTVSRNEWKYDCELELNLDPSLPPVPCFEAELNQVVLNLIVNAVDAVKDAKAKGIIEKGLITIRTFREGKNVIIEIEDNGTGIPDTIRQKVFDPFFTTKEVGKGTGQGLSISHSIIVEKHGGSIDFRSTPGKGTTFIIALPLEEV